MTITTTAIPMVKFPDLRKPLAFGAICARCNTPYGTLIWKAPQNTYCPKCLLGGTFVNLAAWGAGS